jgi:hypothetical protein
MMSLTPMMHSPNAQRMCKVVKKAGHVSFGSHKVWDVRFTQAIRSAIIRKGQVSEAEG